MSDEELQRLEQEVEAARAKLVEDIAALRAPGKLSTIARELREVAADQGGALVGDTHDLLRSKVRDGVEALKGKASANPVAAAMILAGLGWHLARRPPIAAALVGIGLYGFFRTKRQTEPPATNVTMRSEQGPLTAR